MSQQLINVGVTPNDGSGDTLRQGAQKVNSNFTELYASIQDSVTNISAGQGIAISGSLGAFVITNSQPNRGSISLIEVNGNNSIVADSLQTTLTLAAGNNITIGTDNSSKTITLSVNSLTGNVTGNLTGNVTGNLTGNVTGNLTGNVTGTVTGNVDTTRAHLIGNASAAYSWYQGLLNQQATLANNINSLQSQLLTAESSLESDQSQLAFWQSQTPSPNRTNQINTLNNAISSLEEQILSLNTEITNDQASLATVTSEINIIEPTLNTPYASLIYDAVNLHLSVNRTIIAPVFQGSISLTSPLVFPSYFTVDRNALTNVQPGTVLFNKSTNTLQVYTGTLWSDLN